MIKKKCAAVGQGQEGRAQAEDQAGRSQEEGQQRRRGRRVPDADHAAPAVASSQQRASTADGLHGAR